MRFQSTHPCGCDDQQAQATTLTPEISIHAPLRVRRCVSTATYFKTSYFNPRTLAGATCMDVSGANRLAHFNPRTLAGATFALVLKVALALISIHAPLRVRRFQIFIHIIKPKFQSTHPCGCDDYIGGICILCTTFQSTHPCGCDITLVNADNTAIIFQSTHPCGCDSIKIKYFLI